MSRLLVAVLAFVFAFSAAVAGNVVGMKSEGKWVKGSFAQANVGCLQAWVCTAPDVLHGPDTQVVTTDNEGAAGICNADGGDVTGCNTCASNPPKMACQYWLEKK